MQQLNNEIFARKNKQGNYAILWAETGEPITRLDANVYPVGSELSARHEHPRGIILTHDDVVKLGISTED